MCVVHCYEEVQCSDVCDFTELPAAVPGGPLITGHRVAEGPHEEQQTGGHQPTGR